jgi:hypothetical protein
VENRKILINAVSIALIILSITTFIICLIMNFAEFQHGGSTVIRSAIVTLSYAAVWIIVLIIGILIKIRGIVKYCIVFWAITLSTSVAMAYMNAVKYPGVIGEYICNILFPLILLFVGQWYGIRLFVWSTVTRSIIVAVISLVMLAIAIIWLKENKST